jgi:NitT/TauT family transport system substrate-binding protein
MTWTGARRFCLFALGVGLLTTTLFDDGRAQGRAEAENRVLQSNDPFTVAVNMTTIETAPIFVAAEGPQGSGFRIISGGVRQVAAGAAHAGTNAETQMLLIAATNPKVRLVMTVAEGLYRVIARRSAGIRTIADLAGKRIVTPLNTSAHYHLTRMLSTAGLQESDVTLVPRGTTEMSAVVGKREADAISIWEPDGQKTLEVLGDDAIVFQDNKVYRELFSLYTTTDVLNDRNRRAELVRFVRAVIASADMVRSRPQEVIPLVARRISQSEETVARSWKFHRFPVSLPSDVLSVLTEEDRWVARGQKRAPMTQEQLAAFIDSSVLQAAQGGP